MNMPSLLYSVLPCRVITIRGDADDDDSLTASPLIEGLSEEEEAELP